MGANAPPPGEEGGLRDALADRIELLQRIDDRGERVPAETALPRPDAGQFLLAGGGVGAASAAQREPVEGTVGADVAVIPAAQIAAQVIDHRGVLDRKSV